MPRVAHLIEKNLFKKIHFQKCRADSIVNSFLELIQKDNFFFFNFNITKETFLDITKKFRLVGNNKKYI